jgi:hypothetical protein
MSQDANKLFRERVSAIDRQVSVLTLIGLVFVDWLTLKIGAGL